MSAVNHLWRGGASTFEACMRHLWWRFWWADTMFNRPGLYFWAGPLSGNVRLWGFDFFLQILIVALTAPGMWLAGGSPEQAKWGFVVLLAGQPFWLLATWRSRQLGIFLIAVIYTALWARAVFNSF